jgi:putative hydrolase of HD superfamily
MITPEQVVQRQLDAYNARDVDAWLASYHPDAEHYELHGGRIARGRSELEQRIQIRFSRTGPACPVTQPDRHGAIVVDHELITRNFPEGRGHVEMICIYEVAFEVIVRATFALGEPMPEASAREHD